ncbi:MAG: hypothetical protein ACLQLC_06945 [Candidatus Sulfotelmatobacter sp.]
MRRNKNKIVNRFDLGRVPVTSVEVAKPETLRELAIRLEREERERREAPIRAAENQLTVTLRQMTDEYRKVWSMPVEKLRRAERDYLDASTPDLGLPQADYDAMNAEAASTAGQEAKKTLDAFIAELPQRGVTLTADGVTRFSLFVSALAIFRNAAVTLDSCNIALTWLDDCLGDEIHFAPTTIAEPEQVERKPLTLNDVLEQGIDGSRDSDRRLRAAVENDFVAETGTLASQFIEHLRSVWSFRPDDASWRYAFSGPNSLVVRMNWPLHDPRTYDKVRVALTKSWRWPSTMLTAGEVVEAEYARDNDWSKFNYQVQNLTRRGLYNRPRVEAGI